MIQLHVNLHDFTNLQIQLYFILVKILNTIYRNSEIHLSMIAFLALRN